MKHFKEIGEINYPEQKKGKLTWISLKCTQFSKLFRRLKKRANEFLNNYDLPIIIVTKTAEIFAGNIDEYEAKTLILYNGHQLNNNKWISVEGEDQLNWLEFELEEIDKIFTLDPEEIDVDKIYLGDVMELWRDQTYEIRRGIKCDWIGGNTKHSPECNTVIHESLKNIFLHIAYNSNIPKNERSILKKSMENVIKYIVEKGGKISG